MFSKPEATPNSDGLPNLAEADFPARFDKLAPDTNKLASANVLVDIAAKSNL
jgi:hypothetical protein